MDENSYLAGLNSLSPRRHNIKSIRRAITEHGYWERVDEWRISTTMKSRIEPTQSRSDGPKWYRVSVRCDHEFASQCPTLERAVEFLGTYELLIIALFFELGWPGSAEKNRLDP